MKKSFNENWRLLVLDLFAIVALWVLWYLVGDINQDIDSNADTIEFYGNQFLMLITLGLPALHIIVIIELLKPGFTDKDIIKGININLFLILLLVSLVALSFGVKLYFINHIENSGYVYCQEKSRRTSFSKIYVFVRNGSECDPNGTSPECQVTPATGAQLTWDKTPPPP